MKLVIIYGPPASGKLTIASKISKSNNLRLLHNHLTHDFLQNIIQERNESFWSSLEKIRLIILEQLMKNKQDTIMTYTTNTSPKNAFLKKIIKLAQKYDCNIQGVRLVCTPEIILRRCTHKSRKKYKKPQNPTTLKKELEHKELFSDIPFLKSISINTDKLSAKESAKKISQSL